MLLFVPLTDDVLYAQAGPPAHLVPYRCGLTCARELREECVTSDDEGGAAPRTEDALSASFPARRPVRR